MDHLLQYVAVELDLRHVYLEYLLVGKKSAELLRIFLFYLCRFDTRIVDAVHRFFIAGFGVAADFAQFPFLAGNLPVYPPYLASHLPVQGEELRRLFLREGGLLHDIGVLFGLEFLPRQSLCLRRSPRQQVE